ncbi:hypothetical protein PACTADRAFT_32353 [Pachysolen tannophilus NRRL Y-2460]|uniref:Mediator of RNA polymerase II transcription subunit 18 n=1 Tax=Pachysolen tannophilus NRRL Y-2460 TaxID=669874 RepID=A0A1E4TYK8_PACTA|nr:hypothetical protein PACTADRAFT_32353 [Pachysolen tannophilus NRRL Y-2460]
MVHQLSLVAEIPQPQYMLSVSTLAAITGMTPEDLSLHVVLLKPKFPFNPEIQAGKVNQIEQYRIRITSSFDSSSGTQQRAQAQAQLESQSIFEFNKNSNDLTSRKWTIQVSEIPSAGRRTVSSQNIYESTIVNTGAHNDLIGYLDELGYSLETEFWIKGVRFYHNDIIIEIYRIYVKSDNISTVIVPIGEKEQDLAKLYKLELLDKTGKFFVKCFVNVERQTGVESITKANKQLDLLKNELSGLIDLEIPDRIAMDSRVNSKIGISNYNISVRKK